MSATLLKRMSNHFSNEMAVVTPNGKVLSASPAEGLARWKALPESDRKTLADLGKYDPKREPVLPPGGLILKVFTRGLQRDSDDVLQIYRNPRAILSLEAGRDFLWLTEAEWRSLVPAAAKEGDKFPLPRPLVDRFCRRYLIELVRVGGVGGARHVEDVVSEEMTLTVQEVTLRHVRLRLDGSARFKTHGEEYGAPGKGREDVFQLLGFLTYHTGRRCFTRFDVVALSETGHYDEAGKQVLPLGVAFELTQGETPADRTPPYTFGPEYFARGR
jgi:hypothetical protein